MKIAGIVAEYNPFHLGHQYHIQETRRILGQDSGIVCVMSGDFVQRGEAAIFSKFARAEAAVQCGADLIIELPLPWSISSAEGFARGAVDLLGGLGVVEVLSFGSESGDVSLLTAVAESLDSKQYTMELRRFLDEGLSFATCRQNAVLSILDASYGEVLSHSNDNLAVEYLRAIRRGGFPITPLAIRRVGAGHDDLTPHMVLSAAALRKKLQQGDDISDWIPSAAARVFRLETEAGRGPVTLQAMEPLLLSRLRMLEEDAFEQLSDATEGLERKLFAACGVQPNLSKIYDTVKSKRYAHARIRRMTLSAALGIKKRHVFESLPYARILAFNDRGSSILRLAKEKGNLSIVSKPTVVRTMKAPCDTVFRLNAKAHDLYVLAYQNEGFHAGGQDWQESPRYLPMSIIESS